MTDARSSIQAGAVISVRAFQANGACYRWWMATVERVEPTLVVTHTPAGTVVAQARGGWVGRYDVRTYYWLDRPYNLVEVYHPDGALEEIYLHIASPARLRRRTLLYIDHELDVVKRLGEPARVVDEDEFAAATLAFRYSADFQAVCRAAAAEALRLADTWQPAGPPGQP